MMHDIYLHATVKMGVIRLKVLIFISPSVPWHIMTPSELTLISQLCIDSPPVF